MKKLFPFPTKTAPIPRPLSGLSPSARTAIILDVENLTASARRRNLDFDYHKLQEKFSSEFPNSQIHAIYSAEQNDDRWKDYFHQCNIFAHPRLIKRIPGDPNHRAMNSDISIATVTGLVVALGAETIVLGTGDGELGIEIAETVKRISPGTNVATIGVRGSISYRLHAAKNPYIDENLELGNDCLISAQLKNAS